MISEMYIGIDHDLVSISINVIKFDSFFWSKSKVQVGPILYCEPTGRKKKDLLIKGRTVCIELVDQFLIRGEFIYIKSIYCNILGKLLWVCSSASYSLSCSILCSGPYRSWHVVRMPYYELLCLASGKLNRKELGDVLRKTCRSFMNNGGTVTRMVPLGADGNGPRKLAYRIRLNQVSYHTGFYVTFCAFASPIALEEVRRQLRIDERVLRHAVFRRTIADALSPLADANDEPPARNTMTKDDPQYELFKFIQEFQRDFPQGLMSGETPSPENASDMDPLKTEEMKLLGGEDDSVREIVDQLRATSTGVAAEGDAGLRWLSKLEKPERPPDPPKE